MRLHAVRQRHTKTIAKFFYLLVAVSFTTIPFTGIAVATQAPAAAIKPASPPPGFKNQYAMVNEVVIKGAGHWIVQEQTEQVQKGLLDFFLSK